MEIFAKSSNYITKLTTEFQNNKIDKNNFNKNILVNTIFTHFYFKKEDKKYSKIKELQNSTYQSFFILESMQEEKEKKLISKIKDRKSKKIVEDSIKSQRQALLNDLASKKDIKILAEQTYNTYVPPKNISLSLKFQICKHSNYNKKIPKSNIKIKYLNQNLNEREDRYITNNYVECPLFQDFNFEKFDNNDKNNSQEGAGLENNETNESEDFINLLEKEEDEILFYDEKLGKGEKKREFEGWIKKFNANDMVNDFQELKQRKKNIVGQVNDLYITMLKDETIKKEIEQYLKNSAKLYKEISNQEHFHEFTGYLSEKFYKIYMKKMNYSYLIIMLLSFFDYERFVNNYYEILDEPNILAIFLKKTMLNAGISFNKIYDSVAHTAMNKKGHINFEDYLTCFSPILDLPEKYQFYKYCFLLYLVKKKEKNVINLNNFRIFCNLIRGKAIYDSTTCDDIIGKLIPILKSKYPKDDTENLNYQHVSIILEFLVNYEYGE
jgi:hypothetical protein